MSSKFAPDVPSSLIDAVSSILGEAKVEPAKPDPEAVARKKKLDALRDKQEADKAEKGENKPAGVRKVAGHQYGGAKQKDEPEQHDEELKGNQHKIDANKNGKIDAHDFKILRGKKKANEEVEEIEERELTPGEAEKKEKYVKSMKKGLAGFKARYGSKAKNVMYATATKMAKNEETVTEAIVNHEDIAKHLIKKHGKDVSMDHIEDAIDGMDDQHKVDKREVLYHVNKLTKEEVQIDEGHMKDIYTSMMYHADKKGYKSHKDFTPKDYDEVGKEHGISGKELAIIAGHKTAAKAAEESFKPEIAKGFPARGVKTHDLPFTPDKNAKKIATAGKYGYGPSAAKHLAKQGMKSVKEETVEEGTGGPIYPKPFIKLGDLIARAKDMRNIKQATIVTPKDENEVKIKKEEAEQVDETMMGKAGCTSEDDKKKDKKPIDYDKPTFLRKVNDWRKSNPKFQPKKLPMSKAAGALAAEELVYEDLEDHFTKIPSDLKKKMKAHVDKGDFDAAEREAHKGGHLLKYHNLVSNAAHSFHLDYDTRHHDIHDLKPYMSDYLTDKKTNESEQITMMSPEYLERYKQKLAKNNKRFVAAVKRQKNPGSNTDIAKDIEKRYHQTGKWTEEVELDESAGDKLLRAANEYKQSSPEYHKRMIKYHDHMADVHYDNKQKRSEHEENIRHHESELTKLKEEIELDESVKVKKEYDDKTEAEHGVYHNGKKIGYVVHHKPSNTHTAYHSPSSYDKKGHADDYEDIDDFHNHHDAVNQIKYSAGVSVHESIDETAVLDKYIRSMGYDPQHLDKNKKVMFAKTNAFKTYASSQRTEALYDGGQKGTQDIDTHMSPGVTARGK